MKTSDRNRVWTAFKGVRSLVSSRLPRLSDTVLQLCRMADDEHRESKRQYAHVLHIPGTVCVAGAVKDLTRGNLYGVFLHEFGHLIVECGEKGAFPEEDREIAADEAVLRAFGIPICYNGFSGQRTVEWADPAVVERKILDARIAR